MHMPAHMPLRMPARSTVSHTQPPQMKQPECTSAVRADCQHYAGRAQTLCNELASNACFGCRAQHLDSWKQPKASATTSFMFEKVYVIHYTKRGWRRKRSLERLTGIGLDTSEAAGIVSFVDVFDKEQVPGRLEPPMRCADWRAL